MEFPKKLHFPIRQVTVLLIRNPSSNASSFEKQGFYVKLFLFSETMMLYSHVAIQKSAQMISVCGAAFCNRLNCQLWQAFNKRKLIFSISKIYVCFKKLHFHIIYQEWDAVFHQQMKHWEESWSTAEYFWQTLRCFIWWWNSVSKCLIVLLKKNDFRRRN